MSHALELQNICKEFSGNRVLNQVNMHFDLGEVVAIIGHNGAGKSTIMNILDGVFLPTSGKIILDGNEVKFTSTQHAAKNGICMVHQEISLFDNLTVWENMYIHDYRTRYGIMTKKEMMNECVNRTKEMGIFVDPLAKVGSLPVSTKQMLEICREMGSDGKILILDEPTSAIGRKEINGLFKFIRYLTQKKNMCVIYISHKLDEIEEISDRIYALNSGKLVADKKRSEMSVKDMVEVIVGKSYTENHVHSEFVSDETILSVNNLQSNLLNNISFDLKKGEVLGLCGLVGAGRSEILRSIYGCLRFNDGNIKDDKGNAFGISPASSIANGLVYVSEDRKLEGLFPKQDVENNIAMTLYSKYKQFKVLVNDKKIGELVKEAIKNLRIKVFTNKQNVMTLSGGNQQKVVIARCLSNEPKIILLDEPTRGIDISAKEEIFTIVKQQAEAGCGILFVSSDFSELLRVCDRVIYMKEGNIVGEGSVAEDLTEGMMMTIISEAAISA